MYTRLHGNLWAWEVTLLQGYTHFYSRGWWWQLRRGHMITWLHPLLWFGGLMTWKPLCNSWGTQRLKLPYMEVRPPNPKLFSYLCELWNNALLKYLPIWLTVGCLMWASHPHCMALEPEAAGKIAGRLAAINFKLLPFWPSDPVCHTYRTHQTGSSLKNPRVACSCS